MQASRGVASKAPGCTPARQQFMRRARSVTARNSPMQSADYASSLGKDQYLVIGLAHCFEKNEDGKLQDMMLLEPVNAPAMECMAVGARTSFKQVAGVTYGEALSRDVNAFPEEFRTARFCEKWAYRCEAAARTWMRPHAQDNLMDLVPLGGQRGGFNFNLDDKRVMNMTNEVKDEDNIKQDMSIDVYGRKEADEKKAAEEAQKKADAAATKVQQQEEEEDELDKLLEV